jgi:predicted membrane protein
MVHTKLYFSHIVIQIIMGTITPLVLLFIAQVIKLPERVRKRMYVAAGSLAMVGIFAMRWNVVIGGQLFSKSFLGYTNYKMALVTREGSLVAAALTILPLFILWGLVKLLPPWSHDSAPQGLTGD